MSVIILEGASFVLNSKVVNNLFFYQYLYIKCPYANFIQVALKEMCKAVVHNCFGPPALLVEGLLSMEATPSSFYLLVRLGLS